MREILEEFKYGFEIALSELVLFILRIPACIFYVGFPLAISSIIPLLVWLLLISCEVKCAFLIFKILFSVFHVLALPMSMAIVASDDRVPETDPGKHFTPSKDLIIAIYVIINICIWVFI
jgi:hypothetical protein